MGVFFMKHNIINQQQLNTTCQYLGWALFPSHLMCYLHQNAHTKEYPCVQYHRACNHRVETETFFFLLLNSTSIHRVSFFAVICDWRCLKMLVGWLVISDSFFSVSPFFFFSLLLVFHISI
ncbi:hypothetical protein BCR42DRAFT_149560 [Absidia repens]|uniref:Uncharacterized protein n=1 Tax=Absidia repens TaxID=90262 RepID=A0A1X2I3Y9_9FUNG|nr:hypothetical protein BCR42DRAFT_149560 [Absidia repens]